MQKVVQYVSSRRGQLMEWAIAAVGVGFVVFASGDAHADLGQYFVNNVSTPINTIGTGIPNIAGAAGVSGATFSGYKLWQGSHEGEGFKENMKPIVGLFASMGLIGFSVFKAALTPTGG